jgi:hypothetical protein
MKVNDFPEWMSPILVKELRQGMQARVFTALLLILHLAMVLAMVSGISHAARGEDKQFLGPLFWTILYAVLIVGSVFRAMNEVANERTAKTLELLCAAGVNGTRLLFGKWCSLMTQSVLMVVTLLPYVVLRYYLGGVNLIQEGAQLLLGLLMASVLCAFSLAISGGHPAMRRLTGACFGVMMLFGMGIISEADRFGAGGLVKLRWEWGVWLLMTAILVPALLGLGGASLDGSSGGGSVFPRILVWLGWGLLPLMKYWKVGDLVFGVHFAVTLALSALMLFWHLAVRGPVLPVQIQPFRRFGLLGRIAALLLLPHWFGAICLLPLVFVCVLSFDLKSSNIVFPLLQTANFLCAVVFWRLLFSKVREPRIVLILVWAIGGVISGVISSMGVKWPAAIALFPPVGAWGVTNLSISGSDFDAWAASSVIAFLVYFLLASMLALPWMRSVLAVFKKENERVRLAGVPKEEAHV